MDPLWIIRNKVLHPYYWEKSYEPAIQALARKFHGQCFWDIGAGIGTYSFLLRRNFTHVIAIEANPLNVERLKRRILRTLATNITIVPCAISDRNARTVPFTTSMDRNELSSHLYIAPIESRGKTITVETATLDEIATKRLDKRQERVDLVKFDIEGAELKALAGATQLLEKGHLPRILMELHPPNTEQELALLLAPFGYKIQFLDRTPGGQTHFYISLE